MSRSRRPAPTKPAAPASAAPADPGPPPAAAEPTPAAPTTPAEDAGLSRRERRAAARGGAAAKIAGPVAARRVPVPDRQRNFATRRRG